MYLNSLFFSLLSDTTLILFVFDHHLLKTLSLSYLPILHICLLIHQLLFYFLHQQLVKLVLLFLLVLLSLVLVFHLLIPHLLLQLYFSFILLPFLLLPLVIRLCLLLLQFEVLFLFLSFGFFFSFLLLHLLVELFLDLLLKFLLTHSLELLLLLEQLGVKLYQSSPLVIIIAFYLVNTLGCDRTGLRRPTRSTRLLRFVIDGLLLLC